MGLLIPRSQVRVLPGAHLPFPIPRLPEMGPRHGTAQAPATSVQASPGLLPERIIASAQVSGRAGQAPNRPRASADGLLAAVEVQEHRG